MTDDDVLRQLSELERQVSARLAEQEEQLRALRRSSLPDGRAALAVNKVLRRARRAPASLRRRSREAQRKRRVRNERPQVSALETSRRDEIVERYLDAQSGVASQAGT